MSVSPRRKAEDRSGCEASAKAAGLSMLEVDVELHDDSHAVRRDRIRILVDRSSGRAVGVGGEVIFAYEVLELEAGLLSRRSGATVVVEDAPAGAPRCAALWTDSDLDKTPNALRLTAGRVGRSLETLVLGEGPEGGLDLSAVFDLQGPSGPPTTMHGSYRIAALRRMLRN